MSAYSENIPDHCDPRADMMALLLPWAHRLTDFIGTDPAGKEPDGLYDPAMGHVISRGAEAAFPMLYAGMHTKDQALIDASIRLAEWLIGQQNDNGSWFETPGRWVGTSVFQLMALAAFYEHAASLLSAEQQGRFQDAIRKAALFVAGNSRFRRVSTNYIASGAAAIAIAARSFPKDAPAWRRAARRIARRAASRLTTDGLVRGEGHGRRILKKIYLKPDDIEIGYGLEMTLASLCLYARLENDTALSRRLHAALTAHLPFIYPDGTLDGSLGSRGYKWILYGSKTTHGSQMAFGLFAEKDPLMARALHAGLGALKSFTHDGLLTCGTAPKAYNTDRPALYPTITRTCNLALTLAYHTLPQEVDLRATLPCEQEQAVHSHSSLNSHIIRQAPWTATLSGHDATITFAHLAPHRYRAPTGGALAQLYHDRFGRVQLATQQNYKQWELLHLPEAIPGSDFSFCPRILIRTDGQTYSHALSPDVTWHGVKNGKEIPESGCNTQADWQALLQQDGHTALGAITTCRTETGEAFARIRQCWEFGQDSITKHYVITCLRPCEALWVVEPFILESGATVTSNDTGLSITKPSPSGPLTLTATAEYDSAWQRVDSPDSESWPFAITCPMPVIEGCQAVWEHPAPALQKELGFALTIGVSHINAVMPL